MKKYLFLFQVVFFVSCTSVYVPKKPPRDYRNRAYDWKDCLQPTDEYIKKELPLLRACFYEEISGMQGFESSLHFIELNNDGKPDVIYFGYIGGAGVDVVFLLNQGGSYKVLYSEMTVLADVQLKNNRLISYTSLYLGCCAEYNFRETMYSVSDDMVRTLIYQRAFTNYIKFPEKTYNRPKKIMVEKDSSKMRSCPLADDQEMYIYDTISNVLSTYRKGAAGYAWAEQKDSLGTTWVFVEMLPTDKQSGSRMNSSMDSVKTYNLGWMDSRYLKKKK